MFPLPGELLPQFRQEEILNLLAFPHSGCEPDLQSIRGNEN